MKHLRTHFWDMSNIDYWPERNDTWRRTDTMVDNRIDMATRHSEKTTALRWFHSHLDQIALVGRSWQIGMHQ